MVLKRILVGESITANKRNNKKQIKPTTIVVIATTSASIGMILMKKHMCLDLPKM
jgi:hypothetical protein